MMMMIPTPHTSMRRWVKGMWSTVGWLPPNSAICRRPTSVTFNVFRIISFSPHQAKSIRSWSKFWWPDAQPACYRLGKRRRWELGILGGSLNSAFIPPWSFNLYRSDLRVLNIMLLLLSCINNYIARSDWNNLASVVSHVDLVGCSAACLNFPVLCQFLESPELYLVYKFTFHLNW